MLIANLSCSCKKSPVLYSCTDFELRGENLFLFLFTGCRAQLPMSLIDIFFKSRENTSMFCKISYSFDQIIGLFRPIFRLFRPFFRLFRLDIRLESRRKLGENIRLRRIFICQSESEAKRTGSQLRGAKRSEFASLSP